jgi:simple sugar transport system ATP-binding protein
MSADAHEDGVATASDGDAGSQLLQADPVLRVVGLCKRYGHVEALRGADLAVDRGEIVALVGDNGAGKSTFVKAVGGVHEADSGEIWIDGNRTHFRSPHDARRAGVEVVHQDLALAPDLPVWSNLFLGRPLRVRGPLRAVGWLDKRAMRREAVDQLARLHISIGSVDVRLDALSGGQRQAVAVARGVAWGRRLILLDEPTNNLGVPEQLEVLQLIRRLAEGGVGVLIVSHNLEHVFRIAHRIVVLRNGRTVASATTSDTSSEEVVSWITGLHAGSGASATDAQPADDTHIG